MYKLFAFVLLLLTVEKWYILLPALLIFIYLSKDKVRVSYMIVILFISYFASLLGYADILEGLFLLNLSLIIIYASKNGKRLNISSIKNLRLPNLNYTIFVVVVIAVLASAILNSNFLDYLSGKIYPLFIDRTSFDELNEFINEYSNENCGRLNEKELILSTYCPVESPFNILSDGHVSDSYKVDSNADTLLFHGCDTKRFCDMLSSNSLKNLTEEKNIVVTPLFVNSLMQSDCRDDFKKYIENYKKNGDIYNSSGSSFCFMDEIVFIAKENDGVIFIVNGSYKDIKNYAIAYLLDSNFDTTSLDDPFKFLDLIGFPKPCGVDYSNFIAGIEFEYKNKYEDNIIEIDSEGGILIRKPLAPKPNYRYLPLIKTMSLGKNTYLCSPE